MTERSLVLIKPDAVERGLTGQIIDRYLRKGLRIVAMRQLTADAATADAHYAEHTAKDFYPPLREFITSGPLVAMVVEGDGAISALRALNGATNPLEAAPGTVRGDLALTTRYNCVHASDSAESAQREIEIWFPAR